MRQHIRKKWNFKTPDLDQSVKLVAELSALGLPISLLVGQLLIKRGFKTASSAHAYLKPDFENGLHDPFEIADMEKAVDRINSAIKNSEKIYIYGDYDADGTTATALLLHIFRKIGYQDNVDYYIPNRFTDGYGLSKETVNEVRKRGASLLITVDCGITSKAEVEEANDLGMDVIITDHHQPDPGELPPAKALIAPKIPKSEYPFDDLAGVGLAFKLAHGLIGNNSFLESLLDLVVLGTVVDMAPLIDENRVLSRLGLTELNKRARPGINALCEVAGYGTANSLVGHSLSFGLGPRINAAGRMDTADKAVKLLMAESINEAEPIASELNDQNRKRQELEASIRDEAIGIIKREINDDTKGIVVASDRWPEKAQGVVGIVASRLVEMYQRPVFVIAINNGEATGSGRSIDGVNLADSLNDCKELLIKHGGHAAAAGLTLKTKNINKFKEAFNDFASKEFSSNDLQPKLELDFETNLSILTLDILEELEQFEPFGRKNKPPRFCTHRLKMRGTPTLMGEQKQHLSMFVSDGANNLRAIAWQAGKKLLEFKGPEKSLDFAFSPEINEWQGKKSVQLILQDWEVYSDNREDKYYIYPPSDDVPVAQVVDGRNKNKKDYLLDLLDKNESCIIYVQNNEMLELLFTRLLPEKADSIARYDEAMSGQEAELLKKLKDGDLKAIASNTTFPDSEKLSFVKHFVFSHLTLRIDEFFKRCEPAFTSEETSKIHLIYRDSDVTLMKKWISQKYPEDSTLRELYRNLRNTIGKKDSKEVSEDEILNGILGDSTTVETGFMIFEELQFIERFSIENETRLKLLAVEQRDLSGSETYLKGEWIKQTFRYFSEFQLQQDIKKIWERIKDEFGISDSKDSET